jgi:hypothetical protein
MDVRRADRRDRAGRRMAAAPPMSPTRPVLPMVDATAQRREAVVDGAGGGLGGCVTTPSTGRGAPTRP